MKPITGAISIAIAMLLAISACSISEDGSTPGNGGGPRTETFTPPPPPPPFPAADCRGVVNPVQPIGDLPFGTLEAKTDPTNSAMLVTNRGTATLLITPSNSQTSLTPSPYSNPTTAPEVAALNVVRTAPLSTYNPYWPTLVAADQIYVVPPDWSVCALVTQVGNVVSVSAARDTFASAAYISALKLGQTVQSRSITPLPSQALTNAPALFTCANSVVGLLNRRPSLGDDRAALYGQMLGTGTDCYNAYDSLLDKYIAKRAGRTSSAVDSVLARLKISAPLLQDFSANPVLRAVATRGRG